MAPEDPKDESIEPPIAPYEEPRSAAPEPEPGPEPKRRGGRLGLYICMGVLALLVAAWTWWWFTVAHEVEKTLDKASVDLTNAGYKVSWQKRSVSGWPFRTFVKFDDFRIAAPSGHAFHADRLQAEAYAYALDKWVAAAPQGFTFLRGEKGAVKVTGKALRASLTNPDAVPPTLVVELREAEFAAAEGAEPFPLATAELVAFNLEARPGGAGQAAFAFRVENATPRPGGAIDQIGAGERFSTRWEGLVTRFGAFDGGGWAQAARNWSRAGGVLQQVRGRAETGPASLQAYAPQLSAGPDGRLRGSLDISVVGGAQALMSMAQARVVDPAGAAVAAAATSMTAGLNAPVSARVDFTARGAKMGPARLSDSPKVY